MAAAQILIGDNDRRVAALLEFLKPRLGWAEAPCSCRIDAEWGRLGDANTRERGEGMHHLRDASAVRALEWERLRYDANGENPTITQSAGDHWRRASARATAQPRCDLPHAAYIQSR